MFERTGLAVKLRAESHDSVVSSVDGMLNKKLMIGAQGLATFIVLIVHIWLFMLTIEC